MPTARYVAYHCSGAFVFADCLNFQRTSFGDPSFLPGLHQHEEDMLNDTVASAIRGRISDFRTQNVSAYDPDGLESLDTYVKVT